MNCNQFADVLDDRRIAELAPSDRCDFDAHAEACSDCADALACYRVLEADAVPSARKTLDVAGWIGEDRGEKPVEKLRRKLGWRAAAMLGVVCFGGAVFAAASWWAERESEARVSLGESSAAPGTGSVMPSSAAGTAGDYSLIDYARDAELAAHQAFGETLMHAASLPDGDYFPLLWVPPVYPAEAAERGLEGYAVVEFRITAGGETADLTIVESSDPVFEQPSIDVARQFQYKPRVVSGRAVAVEGVRNKIAYVLETAANDTDARQSDAAKPQPESESEVDWREFRAMLRPALGCIQLNDLHCVELELDELLASQDFNAREAAEISRIQGFVYYRQGNYERAIEAYGNAAYAFEALSADPDERFWSAASLMTVARIHYERQQYQEALDAAIEALKATPNPTVAEYVFVDRLRQLGAIVR